jgi:hypothetical protein
MRFATRKQTAHDKPAQNPRCGAEQFIQRIIFACGCLDQDRQVGAKKTIEKSLSQKALSRLGDAPKPAGSGPHRRFPSNNPGRSSSYCPGFLCSGNFSFGFLALPTPARIMVFVSAFLTAD